MPNPMGPLYLLTYSLLGLFPPGWGLGLKGLYQMIAINNFLVPNFGYYITTVDTAAMFTADTNCLQFSLFLVQCKSYCLYSKGICTEHLLLTWLCKTALETWDQLERNSKQHSAVTIRASDVHRSCTHKHVNKRIQHERLNTHCSPQNAQNLTTSKLFYLAYWGSKLVLIFSYTACDNKIHAPHHPRPFSSPPLPSPVLHAIHLKRKALHLNYTGGLL